MCVGGGAGFSGAIIRPESGLLLTVTLIYNTYNFEQMYLNNISFIKCKMSNVYYTQNNSEGRELRDDNGAQYAHRAGSTTFSHTKYIQYAT